MKLCIFNIKGVTNVRPAQNVDKIRQNAWSIFTISIAIKGSFEPFLQSEWPLLGKSTSFLFKESIKLS